MLNPWTIVLTRKQNQSIKIGKDITITVLSMRGHSIKLGVSAPNHIEVHRQEIYQKIQANLGKDQLNNE